MNQLNEPTITTSGITRPTALEVDLAKLTANYHAVQKHTGVAVMPILKANAYGHGLIEVGRHFDLLGASYLGVAYLEEGISLRRANIQAPILVLGGIVGNQIPHFIEYNLTLTASSVDKLQAISECAAHMKQTARVHLKIDTGMERIGVHWYSAEKLISAARDCKNVLVEGIFSHFANSDAPATTLTHAQLQLERFNEVLHFYDKHSLKRPLVHMANSGAVLQLPESYFDMVRPGLLLYGAYPADHIARTIKVSSALRWKTQVVFFKVVLPNNPVSYGSLWRPKTQTRVVTLPVGYGDGYMRAMTGKAEVLINGKRYPVVGRICMDQVMVDIGNDSAYNGDEVVLLGSDGKQLISIEEMATWAQTIAHEILTSINTRVPRLYFNRLQNPAKVKN
ncbi:MAG: alanine racemase [Deltaproteobacteria bacterium]|nr:alanine racemase [Deltaproteobacteria bacterium]